MKKREFLKTSSALIMGSMLPPLVGCDSGTSETNLAVAKSPNRTNWAGNLTYSTDVLYSPKSLEEVQEIIRKADKIRPLGSKHCFNTIADSKVAQISLKSFNEVISLDKENSTVTIGSGMRYGDIAPYLLENGFALHNLASLPHISVVGAAATATHGSGVNNGNLATSLSAIEFVNAEGEIVSLSREKDGDTFAGAVVNLGALGVVTKVTLDLVPAFEVRQDIYLELPFGQYEQNFEEILSAGYSVSLFTDYQTDNINQVWIKSLADQELAFDPSSEFFGAKPADRDVHPIITLSAENCTRQMGEPGPWHERLPHFRMNFTPSSGKELQSEFFVSREFAIDAYKAISAFREEIGPLLMISEIRTAKADDLWMSTAYQRNAVIFHFTWEQDWENLQHLLPKIEQALEPFQARPHWGKIFTISPERLAELYPRMGDFRNLVNEYDPKGKFRNDFVSKNIFGNA